ncbi:MAG: hypothetical protein ACC657_14925 [Thiohalomonadales bacterium]
MEPQNPQYALINFDKTNLLIPQHEVSVIEMIDTVEIQTDTSQSETIGLFHNNSGSWPIFSISTDFKKQNKVMDSDRYCVCLQHPEYGQFGLLCTKVSSFQVEENYIQTRITDMMLLPMNPILKLVYYQNYLYLMSNVDNLYRYLIENQPNGK